MCDQFKKQFTERYTCIILPLQYFEHKLDDLRKPTKLHITGLMGQCKQPYSIVDEFKMSLYRQQKNNIHYHHHFDNFTTQIYYFGLITFDFDVKYCYNGTNYPSIHSYYNFEQTFHFNTVYIIKKEHINKELNEIPLRDDGLIAIGNGLKICKPPHLEVLTVSRLYNEALQHMQVKTELTEYQRLIHEIKIKVGELRAKCRKITSIINSQSVCPRATKKISQVAQKQPIDKQGSFCEVRGIYNCLRMLTKYEENQLYNLLNPGSHIQSLSKYRNSNSCIIWSVKDDITKKTIITLKQEPNAITLPEAYKHTRFEYNGYGRLEKSLPPGCSFGGYKQKIEQWLTTLPIDYEFALDIEKLETYKQEYESLKVDYETAKVEYESLYKSVDECKKYITEPLLDSTPTSLISTSIKMDSIATPTPLTTVHPCSISAFESIKKELSVSKKIISTLTAENCKLQEEVAILTDMVQKNK